MERRRNKDGAQCEGVDMSILKLIACYFHDKVQYISYHPEIHTTRCRSDNMEEIKLKHMRNISHDADFDDEATLSYENYGVEGLLEKIDAWKNVPVKIAVTPTLPLPLPRLITILIWILSGNRELWLWKVLVHQPSARFDPGR